MPTTEVGPKPPSGPKPSKTGGKKSVSISAANSAINSGTRLKKARPKAIEDDDEGIMPYTQAMGPGKHALLLNTDNIQGMLPSPERSPSKNSLFGGFSIDSLVAMSSPVSTVSITKEIPIEEPSTVEELALPSVNSVNEPSIATIGGSVVSLSPLKLPVTAQLRVIEKALPGIKIDRNMRRSIMMAMQDMNYWDEAEEKEFDKLDMNEAQRKAMLLASKLTSKKGKAFQQQSSQKGGGKAATKVSFSQSQPDAAASSPPRQRQASMSPSPAIKSAVDKEDEIQSVAATVIDPQDQAIISIAGKLKKPTRPPIIAAAASNNNNNSDNNSANTNKTGSVGGLRGKLKNAMHAVKDIITGGSTSKSSNNNQADDMTSVIPHSSSASPRSPRKRQSHLALAIDTNAQPQSPTTAKTGRKQRPGKKSTAAITHSSIITSNDIEIIPAATTVETAVEASETRSPTRASSMIRSSMRMMNNKQSMTRSSMNMNSNNGNNNNVNSEIMLAMVAAVAAVNASGITSLTSSISVGNTTNNARDAFDKEIKEQFVDKAVSILVNLHNNPPSPIDNKLSTVSISSSTSGSVAAAMNSNNRKDMKAVLIRKYSSGIVERGLKRAKLSFERAALDYRIQSTKLHRLQEKWIVIIQRAWHRYLGRKCCHRILFIGRTSIDDKITQERRDLDEFRMRVARRRVREEKAFQQWKGVQVYKPTFPLTPILEERVKKTLIRVNSSGVALTPADNDLFKQDDRHLRPDLAPLSDHINATIRESMTNVHEIMHKKRQQALVQQQEEIRRQQRMKEIEEATGMPFGGGSSSRAASPIASAAHRRDSAARMEMLMLGAMTSSSPSSLTRKGSMSYPSPRGDEIMQLTPRQASIAAHLTPTSLPQRQQSRLSVASASAAAAARGGGGSGSSVKDSLSISMMINTNDLIAPRPPTADTNWEEMARVDNTPSIQTIREEKRYKSPAYKMLEKLCGLTEEDIAKHRLDRPQSVAGVVSPRNSLATSSFIFM